MPRFATHRLPAIVVPDIKILRRESTFGNASKHCNERLRDSVSSPYNPTQLPG